MLVSLIRGRDGHTTKSVVLVVAGVRCGFWEMLRVVGLREWVGGKNITDTADCQKPNRCKYAPTYPQRTIEV